MRVSGSASAVESGLGVSLNDYRLARGQQVHVSDRAPLLPATLSGTVISVLGLDNAPRLTSQLIASPRGTRARSSFPTLMV